MTEKVKYIDPYSHPSDRNKEAVAIEDDVELMESQTSNFEVEVKRKHLDALSKVKDAFLALPDKVKNAKRYWDFKKTLAQDLEKANIELANAILNNIASELDDMKTEQEMK